MLGYYWNRCPDIIGIDDRIDWNTHLKTKGYNFEHNYGHGYNGLSNVFAGLMLLAFLIDQILEAFNKTFQAVLKKMVSRTRTWELCRSVFLIYYVTTWDSFYRAILDPPVIVL